jgi:hypothetical protein
MSHWLDVRSNRQVWVLDAQSVRDWPEAAPWSSKGFALLFAAEHVVDVEHLAERAIEQGLAFACAWGPGCSMIEDTFDDAVVDSVRDETSDNALMTSSHADESLEETLEFFLDVVVPAPARVASCQAWVVFPVGAALRERVVRGLQKRGAKRESD